MIELNPRASENAKKLHEIIEAWPDREDDGSVVFPGVGSEHMRHWAVVADNGRKYLRTRTVGPDGEVLVDNIVDISAGQFSPALPDISKP